MKITVKTSTGSYPVITGRGLIDNLPELAPVCKNGTKAVVVTDDNVAPLYLGKLLAALPEGTECYAIPHGESSKNWALAGELLE